MELRHDSGSDGEWDRRKGGRGLSSLGRYPGKMAMPGNVTQM